MGMINLVTFGHKRPTRKEIERVIKNFIGDSGIIEYIDTEDDDF